MKADNDAIVKILGGKPGGPVSQKGYVRLLEDLVFGVRVEAVGWAYTDVCIALDRGDDPRQTLMPDVLVRMLTDLCQETASDKRKNVQSSGGVEIRDRGLFDHIRTEADIKQIQDRRNRKP